MTEPINLAVPLGPTPLAPLPREENHVRKVANGLQHALAQSVERYGAFEVNEIRPLDFAPGWYAFRAEDTHFMGGEDNDGASEKTLVCMRDHVVIKRIGYLPERPLMLEQPDGVPSR
jgi:hypothetical protein